jgi:Amt family ammonium transporter
VIWTVIFGISFAFFKIQNALTKGGIRSKEEDEVMGLDLPEMGVSAYPEFNLR